MQSKLNALSKLTFVRFVFNAKSQSKIMTHILHISTFFTHKSIFFIPDINFKNITIPLKVQNVKSVNNHKGFSAKNVKQMLKCKQSQCI